MDREQLLADIQHPDVFWFNAGAIGAIAFSNILFDSFGGHWVILPLVWVAICYARSDRSLVLDRSLQYILAGPTFEHALSVHLLSRGQIWSLGPSYYH